MPNKELKRLRFEYDLTQDQMAERTGVSRMQYNKIENGKSKGSMRFWLKLEEEFPNENIGEMYKRIFKGRDGNEKQAENHS